MYDAPPFLFITIQICSFSLSCNHLRISLIMYYQHLKTAAVSSIKQYSQPVHTFFSHFCTYLFYIEGNGKEGKVHGEFVYSKMSETFIVHIAMY